MNRPAVLTERTVLAASKTGEERSPRDRARWKVVVGAVGVALLVKAALGPALVPGAFITFYAAVLLSAWYAGFAAGMVATVLSAAAGTYFFMPRLGSPAASAQLAAPRIALFVGMATTLSWVTAALVAARQRSQAALAAARDELEARVAERTAQLSEANAQLRQEMRRRAEAADTRTEDILESVTDGFIALDRQGAFTYVNHSAERLLRRPRETLIGRNIWAEFPEALGSPFHGQYERVLTERVPVDIEAFYPPRGRWFRAHAYPSPEGLSVLFEDVTERHERETTILSDILRALNAHLAVREAFPEVASGLRSLTDCDRSSLTFFDPDYEGLTVVALDQVRTDVQPGTRLRMDDIPAAANVLLGRPHVVPDIEVELPAPLVQTLYGAGIRSALSLPLRGTKRVLGMLTLTWKRLNGPNISQLPLLIHIADAVALAAEKSLLFVEVRAAQERLQALSHRLLEVQEAERRHIARELHDEVGQALTALKLALDPLARQPAAADARLREAQALVDHLLERVRSLALDLRPAMLDDLGLLPALLWLIERFATQAGLHVSFEHRGLGQRFASDVETTAYRIVQEALTNVARHAATARATVRAWVDETTLNVQIVDQGRGFAPEALATGASRQRAIIRQRCG